MLDRHWFSESYSTYGIHMLSASLLFMNSLAALCVHTSFV
jgi:hypothetical protein